MKETPKIIKRKRMTFVLYPEKVIVGFGLDQWASYNPYDNWNRQGITEFRKRIIKSKEIEYDNPTDLLTLVHECGIRGTGTSKPKGVEL